MTRIDFATSPERYRHWHLAIDGNVARLAMKVDPSGGLNEGYELKLNSYDLGVDIELADAVQRLRFEHPEVGAVVLCSALEGVFCAGANIRMLGGASHAHKVNFCKFTNETRLAIEEASQFSGQTYLAAINGTAAGGGYELAMTAEHIILVDDRRSGVSLPETPLLAVLPGTGGLTRLTDKRRVRRDRADLFCTLEEGVRGKRALEWRLVDELAPPSAFDQTVAARAAELAQRSDRPTTARGITLFPLARTFGENSLAYPHLTLAIDRALRRATLTLAGPDKIPPDLAAIHAAGAAFWPLALARALDDAILHLRSNEPEIGVLVFQSQGDPQAVLAIDALLEAHREDWLVREIRLFLRRVFKRLDMTARSLFTLIAPGSCFAGTLAELVFAADRAVMFAGAQPGANQTATIALSPLNFGAYPMGNGLTRLAARFYGEPEALARAQNLLGTPLGAAAAETAGLVTLTLDATDWEDEIRLMLAERASFSPDALTAMEANLRFPGPETMETRIFGRLTAWQNWVFQRPNAVGEKGALKRYGSGVQPEYDRTRV
uniref:Benzoyl-CoA-dihydrodiol lyase n=1 Tax=Acidicaldus sp. TaxID=1872105 RepID=A0A8J4HB57_9PROT